MEVYRTIQTRRGEDDKTGHSIEPRPVSTTARVQLLLNSYPQPLDNGHGMNRSHDLLTHIARVPPASIENENQAELLIPFTPLT